MKKNKLQTFVIDSKNTLSTINIETQPVKIVATNPNMLIILDEIGQLYEYHIDKKSLYKNNSDRHYKSISHYYRHMLFIDEHNYLWVWGDNQYGQLGLGHNRYVNQPIETEIVCKQAVAGYNNSFIIDDQNELYVAGMYNGKQYNRFTKIKGIKCKLLSSGIDFFIILTLSGEIYVSGHNGSGQLGTEDYNDCHGLCRLPVQGIVDVVCGDDHTVLLDKYGRVHVMGNNDYNQLPSIDKSDINKPSKIPGYYKWVSAAGNRTATIDEDGLIDINQDIKTDDIKAIAIWLSRNGVAVVYGHAIGGGCTIC